MAATYVCKECGLALPIQRAFGNICNTCAAKQALKQQEEHVYGRREEKDITDRVERVITIEQEGKDNG